MIKEEDSQVGGVRRFDDNGMGCATASASVMTASGRGGEGGGGGISCSIHSKCIPGWSIMFYVMHLSLLLLYT